MRRIINDLKVYGSRLYPISKLLGNYS